jgi:hypothetical protein
VTGLIVNVHDDLLPADSPWRTREESRFQPPLFHVDDLPVYEVWFWHSELRRWFCMSKSYNVYLARSGVVYFDTKAQLIERIRQLGGVPRAA